MKKYMPESHCRDDGSLLRRTATLLNDYFAGQLKEFDIPLALYGSEFQLSVWNVLRMVPYGVTATYKAVAEAAGHPHGVRAVASAVGANPVSILIPCHRIIGSDGTLTGYAGGIEAKRRLLQLECRMINEIQGQG